jgi:hypothetical protein
MNKPQPPTHTFRAVWPIVQGTGTASTDAELILQALGDLPNVAHRHHATIVGPPRACIMDGRRIPGSGGHANVVIIEAPAVPTQTRPYHHKTQKEAS